MEQTSTQEHPGRQSAVTVAPASRHRRRAVLRWLARFVRNGLAVVGLLSIIYHTCFHLSVVVSGSMAPTLQGDDNTPRDWILSERVSYWFREPQRWEVVEFWTDEHMVVAKRIVGLPGEDIAIRSGRAFINGAPVRVPEALSFLHYFAEGMLRNGLSRSCGGSYFLLGDDSEDSYDSRYEGPVDRSTFNGRVRLIVWPPSRIGWVR
jgi:signal peptidase I